MLRRNLRSIQVFKRYAGTAASTTENGGDISSVFPSLVGQKVGPLSSEFVEVQKRILIGNEANIQESWARLLPSLSKEVDLISRKGNKVIPDIDYSELKQHPNGDVSFPEERLEEIKKRGVAIVRNVFPQQEARQLKFDAEEYIGKNPVHGFPHENPTVYELYWSKSQIKGRTHPKMLSVQRALQSLWHSTSPHPQAISVRHPTSYADRLRIRLPGDQKFMLGPHIDGGSVERWEDPEYSRVYSKIFENDWENYDPFDYRHRLDAKSDLHNGQGQCSMFRMFQGWLSMSETGPGEGTLRVNPMLKHATAYVMLRPFFAPKSALTDQSYDPNNGDLNSPWVFTGATTCFPNAQPGCGQELNNETHPHLHLDQTMVSLPKMNPGDYVAWHCDTIHAVENEHRGKGDSSVLYIPATPLTQTNLDHLVRQRAAFQRRSPSPDFPDAEGNGEKGFVGVGSESDVLSQEGLQAMGLEPFETQSAKSDSEAIMLNRANKALF